MRAMILSISVVLVLLLSTSCGSSSRLQATGPEQFPGVDSDVKIAGMPTMSQLPVPSRQLSFTADALVDLVPWRPAINRGCTPTAGEELIMDASSGMVLAMFGLGEFDGDSHPSSVLVDVADITGEYWVAISDFENDSWLHTGPFADAAEVTLNYDGDFPSPSRYTNKIGNCYFTIIVPMGSIMTLSSLRVGVRGGTLGPANGWLLFASGGENGLHVTWRASPDGFNPDFAGYFLERAPIASGEFTRLTSSPTRERYYIDMDIEPAHGYRYRLCAMDVSGHMSPWLVSDIVTKAGAMMQPVPVLELPENVLYGPVGFTFDMSGSFDPEGGEITNYMIDFMDTVPDYSSASPTAMRTLQPGVYQFYVVVASDWGANTQEYTLKVYPTWEESPSVVHAPDPLLPVAQLRQGHAVRMPGTNDIALIGSDRERHSMVCWLYREDGSTELFSTPTLDDVVHIGEAVVFGDSVYLSYKEDTMFKYLKFDGNALTSTPVRYGPGSAYSVVARQSDTRLWYICDYAPGPMTNLMAFEELGSMSGTVGGFAVAVDIGALQCVDAEYDSVSGMIDIAYSDLDSVEWVRWDPATTAVVDSAVLDPVESTFIDLEHSPAGNPVVLFKPITTGNYTHREIVPGGLMSPPLEVDPSNPNFTPADLVYSDNTAYCYFASDPGQARLYEYDGLGTWTTRNTVSFSSDSAYMVGLVPMPGSENLIVADRAGDNIVYLAQLEPGGVDSTLWTLPPYEGNSYSLHGAAGADGLHAIWRSSGLVGYRHFISPDAGDTWSDAPAYSTAQAIDLGQTADGEVYLAAFNTEDRLLYWDGGAWVQEQSVFGEPAHFSALLCDRSSALMSWVVYREASHDMLFYRGNQANPFMSTAYVPSAEPVWAGAVGGWSGDWLICLAGGTDAAGSSIGLYSLGGDPFRKLAGRPAYSHFYTADKAVRGRTLAGAHYSALGNVDGSAYWIAPPGEGNALRCDQRMFAEPVLEELEWQHVDQPGIGTDFRCTASSAVAFTNTAVGLVSSLNGGKYYFEWIGNGTWEELPLPPRMEHMSMPELVVDHGGRWHIIYRNWMTDEIMCRSTR